MASRVIPLEEPEEPHEASDYIENQLLKLQSYKAKSYTIDDDIPVYGNEYIIDGIVFTETIRADKFREFEVYKLEMDDYADTSGVSIDEDTHLNLTIELVPYGIIINSNVYLSHQQWNTIYPMWEGQRCAVCDVSCDVKEHPATAAHTANMERHRPLSKYDLSITRKINNNYHCGVCNLLFDQSLKDDHFSSKMHEDKLLFAINKVSDIMYDSNIHNNNDFEKKDSYHFNAKAINNNNIQDESSEDEDSDDNYNDFNYNDHWNSFNGLKYNDDGDLEEPAQNLEFSYATMAKKPKSDELPDVLEVDLGNKKVTVKFNSWNMLIRPIPNRFYCMACKKVEHVRHMSEHCKGEEHLGRLAACAVVDQYEKYFVRQVDDKCYHCGHCNNLQLIDVMEDHIRSHHTHPTTIQALSYSPAKKISTPIKNQKNANSDKQDNKENQAKHANNAKNDQDDTTVEVNKINVKNPIVFSEASMFEALKVANSNLEDIVICTFGSKIRISKLAFNIVCQGENGFYCGMCEVNLSMEHLKHHMNDMQHLKRLQRTPFIQAFSVHLFRQIRDALHCGLCNELVQIIPEFIIKHKYLEKHIVSLNRSLGYIEDNTEIKSANDLNNGAKACAKPVTTEISKMAATNGVTRINKTINSNNVVNTANKETAVIKNNVAVDNIQSGINNNKNLVPSKITNTAIVQNTANGANNASVNDITAGNNKKTPVAANNTTGVNKNVVLNIALTKDEPNDETNSKTEEVQTAKNEEFIVVKNGVKEEIPDDLDDSLIDDFDVEEYVYIKLGNSYIKITNTSYNTLVDVGDGGKYCFVCSSLVNGELSKHVESRGHMENMDKIKFVDKYNEDLLRQFYLMYHCSICNVIVTRKQLNHHLGWPTHALQTENTKISSKKRKNEIKSGTKQITVTTQKENIYFNEKENDIKVFLNIGIDKETTQVERLNKIVIFNDNVLKVSFDCWHSVSEAAGGFRCKVCQCEFDDSEFGVHVSSEWHKGNLDKIEKQYSPALIRKINDTTLNCIMCNTEVSNKKHIVTEHIQGKKHIKHYEAILKESSVANSYADCDQDVLML